MKHLNLLLVEDNPGDARLLSVALAESTHMRFRLSRAETLREAIATIRAGAEIDVILLDLTLPDANGAETVRRMREAAPDHPILILTGDDNPDNAERMLALGAQDYLWKGDATSSSIARAARYAITRMQHLAERNAMLARADFLVRELKDTQTRLTRFLDCMPQHLAVLDGEGRIIMVNDAWRRFATENGGADDFFVGHSYLGTCDPGDGAFDRGVMSVLAGESASFSMEYPCHAPTEQRWFKVDVSPVVGSEGGAIVAHTNISDMHRVEEELRTSLETKNRIVGMLAHDLRNPLGAIGGYAELLEMVELGISTKGHNYLATIRQSVGYMNALVEDALAFAVLDAAGVELVKKWTDLSALARRSVAVMQGVADEKGVTIAVDAAPVWGECDVVKMEQLLNNLIGNAIKFSRAGDTVAVRVLADGDEIRITVADEGIGIPPAVMANLFKPFAKGQAGTAGEHSNGLGLYICSRIAAAHGGHIDVESTTDQGTSFVVSVPHGRDATRTVGLTGRSPSLMGATSMSL